MFKLAVLAAGVSGSTFLGAASAPALSMAEITQLIIAVTGLVAAISAFVLGLRSRREDPRDKLLELLLEERKEVLADGEDQAPEPRPRRKRRAKP